MTVDDSSYAGHLLIATPLVKSPPFQRSVVYLGEHGPLGALGVILNNPTNVTVFEILPNLADLASAPAVIHLGGPVQTDAAIVLARSTTQEFAMGTAFPDIGVVDPSDPPADTSALRVYAGFSGWGPGQLEEEIATGSWWRVVARREDLFTSDDVDLWARSVRRVGGRAALHVTYPDDPSVN